MDFNQLAKDLMSEYKRLKVTDIELANYLCMSRQAFSLKVKQNRLTTEDLTRLSAHIVTYFGGGTTLLNFVDKYSEKRLQGDK